MKQILAEWALRRPRGTLSRRGGGLLGTRFDSIVFLAGGRRTAELGWAALGSHLETNIWHRRGVCHLLNLFPFTMFKLSQGLVQFLGLFLAAEQKNSF